MDVPADSLEVAIQGTDAFIRVSGRGSFKQGPALKQFGVAAVERGCRQLIVDLGNCVGMDSTFMGVLAGLALAARRKAGSLTLRAASEKNANLIRTLGLSHLVCLESAAGPEAPAGNRLETATDTRTLAETMLSAHETLVTVSADNLPKFKDVLAYLKEDLNNQTGAGGEGPGKP